MSTDVVVIGGGIAGVAVGYYLSDTHRVTLVEAEAQLAQHSTGRSAALYFENYGAPAIRPLTAASRDFFHHPPPGLTDSPLVTPRGAMWVGRHDQRQQMERIAEEGRAMGAEIVDLTPQEVAARVPVLRTDRLAGGLWEPDPLDIDVAGCHQAFLRGLRRNGGEILTSAPVDAIAHTGRGWELRAGNHTLAAKVVVNAAGAWGDVVAARAGVAPVGLTPMRRTAFMVEGSSAWRDWPMVVDVDHDFYFKPDGPQLLCSPADETPMPPGDARPDPLDVALAIERINYATTLGIRSVRSEWAGLRTFTADRGMVIGPDPAQADFVWLVGQGGTGIQTAPAAGELAAALVRGDDLPDHLRQVTVAALAPARPTLEPSRLGSG